ncbi:hypothetical protein J3D55_001509 [Chryseobacterium ginsenosidimutans]|uniref:hypothetical protein n=1 Tax=Chryseobacterium ginsenosidimutans TaxID=687846 RepID=UPI002167AE8F|nr:hypothetical protein [Chryseobacterium ginsenosidimutans]MCS3868593.1 hypothetical protein [Chryseobacterium ginsenosidimutans]
MKILLILFVTFISSCTKTTPKYMHGYIYNSQKKPLKGIKIEDPYNISLSTFTNSKGYFKINALSKGEFLYVKKNNIKLDSIYIVRTHPERGVSYAFVEGRNDTLFIDLKK